MTKFQITHDSTDQNWTDENTIEWFIVEQGKRSEIFGVSATNNESPKMLDDEGYPIDECNQIPCLMDELIEATRKVNPGLV